MAEVIDDHRRVAAVVTGRDESLRHAVDARLEIHRGLGPKTSQNADGLHDFPCSHRRRVLAAHRGSRFEDNRTRADSDELPPGESVNHVTTLPFLRNSPPGRGFACSSPMCVRPVEWIWKAA